MPTSAELNVLQVKSRLSDPDTMAGPSCCLLGCVCATLPEVKVGQYGWYSSLAVAQDSVLVSAYDSDYGDLVVSEFDNEGQLQSVTYVDGFTTTDPVVGDPNGLRSGRDVRAQTLANIPLSSLMTHKWSMSRTTISTTEHSCTRRELAVFGANLWSTKLVTPASIPASQSTKTGTLKSPI